MRSKLIFLCVLLASCSGTSMSWLSPYKMDIRQGNYITPEMREKLKFGMTRQQVRYVLGTPLVSDAFHGNRWDYVYRLEQHSEIVEKQRLTLLFDGDNLVSIDDGTTVQTAPPAAVAAPVSVEASKPEPVAKVDPAAEVLQSVQGWAAAWSARDADKYLASYAPAFKPDGMSKAVWEKQRRKSIGKARRIAVEVSELNVKLSDDRHASATFKQALRSGTHQAITRKTLQLEKSAGAWLIVSEQVEK